MISDNREFNEIYSKVVKNGYDFGTGSWAVVSGKIQMRLNSIGEYHPYLTKKDYPITDNELIKFKESCLSLSSKNEDDISKELFSNIPNVKYDKRLGYYSGLYIGHVLEGNYRENGSSGGFGSWILKELLRKNEIDYVINVVPTGNNQKLFEYQIASDIKGIVKGSKTKYYPVEFSKVINKVKSIPGRYAIVGLPSYIMELRLLSEIDPLIKERIKYTIGLVCGHQKSTKFGEFLAWQCGIKPGNLHHINFRKKMDDFSSNQYGIEVTGDINGKETTIVKKMSDLIGSDWGEALFKVRASDFTDDVMNETADITLGDAWLPEYTKDSKGNNILVVRNTTINDIIKDAIKEEKISVDESDVNTIYRSQSAHYRHTRMELGYRLYRKKKNKEWFPKKRELPNSKLPWIRKKIQNEREKICVSVPTIYNEAVRRDDITYFIDGISSMRRSYKNIYKIKRILSKLKKAFV